MIYYLDTEFIEYPNSIHLISLGIVAEDGREFYAENYDADLSRANKWVKEFVIPATLWKKKLYTAPFATDTKVYGDIYLIKDRLLKFIGDDKPEFWGYFADYDWVVFCWLFGTMMDLPEGWPMFCRDLRQLADVIKKPDFAGPITEHNALEDARWNKLFHEYLLKG